MQKIMDNLHAFNETPDENSVNNPNIQREIFDLIERVYFIEPVKIGEAEEGDSPYASFGCKNVVDYELKKLNRDNNFNKLEIKKTIKKLEIQSDVLNKKVSDIILQKSQEYSAELQRVTDFKVSLEQSYQVCAMARSSLFAVEHVALFRTIDLIKKQMKKTNMIFMYKTVNSIKMLLKTNTRINEMIDNNEFSLAIDLCFKSEKEIKHLEKLKCVKVLKDRVKYYYRVIEQCLDQQLAKLCIHYEEQTYANLIHSYKKLNSHMDDLSFVEKLKKHIMNALSSMTLQTILDNLARNERLAIPAHLVDPTASPQTTLTRENSPNLLEDLKKVEFKNLCKLLDMSCYRHCINELYCNIWQVMKNYYRIYVYELDKIIKTTSKDLLDDDPVIEKNINKSRMLESCLGEIWLEVQKKLSVCLSSMSFELLKFDEFIEIITMSNKFIRTGYEYCNKKVSCKIIVDSVKDQTLSYFRTFHYSRLEELRMFLENEIWQWCPVKKSFSIIRLHDFKFLIQKNNGSISFSETKSVDKKSLNSAFEALSIHEYYLDSETTSVADTSSFMSEREAFFQKKKSEHVLGIMSQPNPFQKEAAPVGNQKEGKSPSGTGGGGGGNEHDDESKKSDMEQDEDYDFFDDYDSDDSDVDVSSSNDSNNNANHDCESLDSLSPGKAQTMDIGAYLKAQIKLSKMNNKTPIITNTTLNIMRLFGKYLQMLSMFKIISSDVIGYLMQLFYFYFYSVYTNFIQQVDVENIINGQCGYDNSNGMAALVEVIKEIKQNLFNNSGAFKLNEPVMISNMRIPKSKPEYHDCINNRIVAAESLIFLAQELEHMFPLIKKFLASNLENGKPSPAAETAFNNYLNTIKKAECIRIPMYLYIARIAIDYNLIQDMISKVNWDLSDIMSENSAYVDILLKQVKQIKSDFECLQDRLPMDKYYLDNLLRQCFKMIMKMFVDGYSSIRKCSNEGRALMQLDFQQFVVKLEKLCDLRPIPDKDFVDAFIKAFYLPDSSIEKWIKEHPEYSQKNITGLLNVMGQISRKTRQSIINSFDSPSSQS